jgi:hypothetical protein
MSCKKYKRGDKHPTKNLIFWQYHHPFYKETNGEVWHTPEKFEENREKHRLQTAKYKRRHPLMYIVSGTIQRDKQKYQTSREDIINLKFIKQLLKKQNNKCYWYNIELEIDSIEGSRNPAKLTIDRLDCSKGYLKDNVVLTCYAANCGRADCSIDNWKLIIENIKNGLNTKS